MTATNMCSNFSGFMYSPPIRAAIIVPFTYSEFNSVSPQTTQSCAFQCSLFTLATMCTSPSCTYMRLAHSKSGLSLVVESSVDTTMYY